MLALWRAQRARNYVVATIAPLIAQSRFRLEGIAEAAWSDAYVVGFLGMLITYLAEKDAGALGTNALAFVQTTAWHDLTEQDSGAIGERIVLLSSSADEMFELGRRNAARVAEAIVQAEQHEPSFEPAAICAAQIAAEVEGLWNECFDARLPR